MSDIDIRIKSSFDAAGTTAATKSVQTLDKAAAQAAISAQRLATEEQRTATAANQAAAAAQRLATEEQKTATAAAQAAAAQTRAEAAALRYAQAQQKAADGGSSFAQKIGSEVSGQLLAVVGPAAIASAALAGVGKGMELAQMGAQAQAARASFDNLTRSAGVSGSALLAQMKVAAGGTIAESQLIQSANTATLLAGEKMVTKLPQLIEIARASAQATGQDIGFVFDSLVRGIARGSPMIIDNAGITLNASQAFESYAASIGKSADQLTKEEQQQATLNAVLARGGEIVQQVGVSNESAAASQQRAAAAWDNITTKMGEALATSTLWATEGVSNILNAFDGTSQSAAGAVVGIENFLRASQGLPPVTDQVSSSVQGNIASFLTWIGVTTGATATTEANTGATQANTGAMDAERAAIANAVAEREKEAASLADDLAKKQASEQQTAKLAQAQATLAGLGNLVAGGLMTSGQAAAQLAAMYGIAYAEALKLIQAQAQLAGQKGVTMARVEQGGGRAAIDEEKHAMAERGRIARQQENEEIRQAKAAQTRAIGTTQEKIALAQREYDAAVKLHGAGSVAAINAQTKLLQEQERGTKARTSAAGAGADKLAGIEEKTADKIIDIEQRAQDKLIAIDRKAAEARAAAYRKLQADIATSTADRRAANEADDLDLVGTTDPKEAARLNDRERAERSARERSAQAAAEARAMAERGEAESAEKIYGIRQQQIDAQQQLDEKYYEKQRELGPKQQEELTRQYDEATRANEEAANARIGIVQAEADQRAQALQAEKDAVIAAAEEEMNQVIAKATTMADGVKRATESAKQAAVANIKAIGDSVNSLPTEKTIRITVEQSGKVGTESVAGGTKAAGGGTFVTTGKTTLTVGDNPGGRELVTVTPIGGRGTTSVGAGMIRMAGGGVIDAGDGYTTPIAGGAAGGGGGGGGGKKDAAKDAKAAIEEQRNVIQLLEDLIRLRHDLAAELASGTPFDVEAIRWLARRAAEFTAILRGTVIPITKQQGEDFRRYTDAAQSSIGVLKDVADLRASVSAALRDSAPFDMDAMRWLARRAAEFTDLIRAQLVPITETEKDRVERFASLVESSVSTFKAVLDLRQQMFSDYVPPSDAQIQQVARDADRLAQALTRAAATYDTKVLAASKEYADVVGKAFANVKDGLLAIQALNSGDFVLAPGALQSFERQSTQILDTTARLAARAKAIPPGEIGALQTVTAAIGAQAEALIKLAAVPWGDLPRATGGYAGSGGAMGQAGGLTVQIYNPPAGLDVPGIVRQVKQALSVSVQTRRA